MPSNGHTQAPYHPQVTPQNVALAIGADLAQRIVTAAQGPHDWGDLEQYRAEWMEEAFEMLRRVADLNPALIAKEEAGSADPAP
jgi:hypothetical protein